MILLYLHARNIPYDYINIHRIIIMYGIILCAPRQRLYYINTFELGEHGVETLYHKNRDEPRGGEAQTDALRVYRAQYNIIIVMLITEV